jgi:hypothetical protein
MTGGQEKKGKEKRKGPRKEAVLEPIAFVERVFNLLIRFTMSSSNLPQAETWRHPALAFGGAAVDFGHVKDRFWGGI